MSEVSWYYTIDSERQGPVTMEVLRALIEKKRLGGEELVWKHGMENWMPVGDVIELKGAAAPAAVVVPDVPVAPVRKVGKPMVVVDSAPGAVSEKVMAKSQPKVDLDALEPAPKRYEGIGRLAYFVIPLLVVGVGGYFVFSMFEIGMTWQVPAALALLLAFVAGVLPSLSRLKNLGMSGWNFFWLFIPVMNVWVQYRMTVCPTGYQDHKTLDKAGKILLIIYVVCVLLYSLGLVFGGARAYADASDRASEFMEQEKAKP